MQLATTSRFVGYRCVVEGISARDLVATPTWVSFVCAEVFLSLLRTRDTTTTDSHLAWPHRRRDLLLSTRTMKTAVSIVALLGSASAFAPSSSSQRGAKSSSLAATSELDSLFGVDIETGNKIVSAASERRKGW
jgi:hypothetical protein